MMQKYNPKVFQRYFERNDLFFHPVFDNQPDVFVVIPVLDDEDIFQTIDCLCRCSHEEGNAGVVIVVNHDEAAPAGIKEANRLLGERLRAYTATRQCAAFHFQVVEAFDLPVKVAGVGLARKIGMDGAAWWLWQHGKADAPVLSLDADTWVEPNYTDATCRFFRRHAVAAVSLAYAHRLAECEGAALDAMVKYELYLRYYRAALKYAGHPHAFSTIGSAFAVRAGDYVAEGGMNKRQAGEDFYFIQKLIDTGRYADLTDTRVYPSPRFSERTPFGTGQALRQIIKAGGVFLVYCWQSFYDLRLFLDGVGGLYRAGEKEICDYIAGQAQGMKAYLLSTGVPDIFKEVNANCSTADQFKKRFFSRFNAFRVLKYLNFVHASYYGKEDIVTATDGLFHALGYPALQTLSEKLYFLRTHPD